MAKAISWRASIGQPCADRTIIDGFVVDDDFEDLGVYYVLDHGATVHVTATIGPEVTIGAGAHIGANVDLGEGTEIGAFAHIGFNSEIGPNVIIGAHAHLGYGTKIGEGAKIYGEYIGPNNAVPPNGEVPSGACIAGEVIPRDPDIGIDAFERLFPPDAKSYVAVVGENSTTVSTVEGTGPAQAEITRLVTTEYTFVLGGPFKTRDDERDLGLTVTKIEELPDEFRVYHDAWGYATYQAEEVMEVGRSE